MIRQIATHTGLACLILLSAAGCATRGAIRTGEEIVVGQVSFASEETNTDFRLFPEYKISPGDVLDVLYQVRSWEQAEIFKIAVDHKLTVRFFKHPELSETQGVRPDGKISLPLVGSVEVVGRTVEELTTELKALYSKHLTDPELHIVVDEFRGAIKELKEDLKTAPRGLSRLVTVRPDGFATFAMVGDVKVSGRTVPAVAAELTKRYESILPGLSVDLFLERHYGSRIYVFGEVAQPGSFQILKPTSIFEALAMAGSILPSARIDSTIIFRQKENQVLATRIDLKRMLIPMKSGKRNNSVVSSDIKPSLIPVKRGDTPATEAQPAPEEPGIHASEQMFYLHPDDIVYIPRRRLTKMAEVAREISGILFFRGWGFSMDYNLEDDF